MSPQSVYPDKDFAPSLKRLRRAGGQKEKIADKVFALLGKAELGEGDPFDRLQTTNHGESRIAHCTKYDLGSGCRLVTVFTNGCRLLLFVGDHEETERWIESHKGCTFGIDEDKRIASTSRSSLHGASRITRTPNNEVGKLLDRLPEAHLDALIGSLASREVKEAQKLEGGATDDAIYQATRFVTDADKSEALYDVLVLLNHGDTDGAINRININLGKFRPLDELNPEEVFEIRSGSTIKKFSTSSNEYQTWLRNYVESEHPYEWFLFMHPEQEAFVDADYSGPVKLSGVSGSGKTSIAIRRAIRLAHMYPNEKILILTLNRALAGLISQIVDHACRDESTRSRIETKSMFSLGQELLREFEPDNARLYTDTTWGLEEHKDEVYREYYRCLNNFSDAEVMLPTHRLLVARGIDAERYLFEEFDWIRSATNIDRREEEYLTMPRKGRRLALDVSQRAHVLKGLDGWEHKMTAVGVVDHMGLITALSRHASKIKPKYRSVIVDEAQDFGTTELQIVRALVAPSQNDLFMCGDAAQLILPKHQILAHAGIETGNRSFKISRNYRNSREILECAHKILFENLADQHFENSEMEISDPKFAYRSSAAPVVLEAESLQQEISAAIRLLRGNIKYEEERGRKHTGCIAIAGYSHFEVTQLGLELGIKVLDAEHDFLRDQLFLSDLEQTKGHEFDTVVVVNCTNKALPPEGVPDDETYRHASQLYVAITRAKTQVVLSYSGELSAWLSNERVGLRPDLWSEYEDLKDLPEIQMPGFLPEFPDQEKDGLRPLTGRQFLYTPYARGFDTELQDKFAELIDGSGLIRNGKRIKWKNIGALLDDYDRHSGSDKVFRVFGKYDDVVRERLVAAIRGTRPVMQRRSPAQPTRPPTPPSAPRRANPTPPAQPDADPGALSARNTNGTDELRALNLSPRHMATLHGYGVRNLTDLFNHAEALLRHMTEHEVRTLLRKARQLQGNLGQQPAPGNMRIATLGLDPRLVEKLARLRIERVQQLQAFTLSQLRASPLLNATDLQQITRVARTKRITLRP